MRFPVNPKRRAPIASASSTDGPGVADCPDEIALTDALAAASTVKKARAVFRPTNLRPAPPAERPPTHVIVAAIGPKVPSNPPTQKAIVEQFGRSMQSQLHVAKCPGFGRSMLASGVEPIASNDGDKHGKRPHDFDKQHRPARIPGQTPSRANDAIDNLESLLEEHGLAEFYIRPTSGKAVMVASCLRKDFIDRAEALNMTPDELELSEVAAHGVSTESRGGRPFRIVKIMADIVQRSLTDADQKAMSDKNSP